MSDASITKSCDGYEQYLQMLQERNRLLKRLRQKDNHQAEMEKREQGFTLYINGANFALGHNALRTKRGLDADFSYSPKDKLVLMNRPRETVGIEGCRGEDDDGQSEARAKTAPTNRKCWKHNDVELRTDGGQPLHVEAPGALSGRYEDDFEVYEPDSSSSQEKVEEELEDYHESECSSRNADESEEDFDDLSVILEDDSVPWKSLLDSEELKGNGEDEGDEEDIVEEVCVEEVDEEEEEDKRGQLGTGQRTGQRTGSMKGNGIVIEFESQQHPRKAVSLTSLKTKASSLESYNAETRLQCVQSTSGLDEYSSVSHGNSLLSRAKFPQSNTQTFSDTLGMKEVQVTEQNVVDLSKAMQTENEVISGGLNDHFACRKSSLPNKQLDDAVSALKEALVVMPNVSSHLDRATSTEKEFGNSPSATDSARLPGGLGDHRQDEGKVSESNDFQTSSQDQAMAAKPGFRVKPVLLNCDAFKRSRCHAKPVEAKVSSHSGTTSSLGADEIKGNFSEPTAGQALKLITEKIRSMNSKQHCKLLALLNTLDDDTASRGNSPPQVTSLTSQHLTRLNTLDDDTASRGHSPPQVTSSTAQHLTVLNTLDDDTASRGYSPPQVTLSTAQHLTLCNTLDDDTTSRGHSPPQIMSSTAQHLTVLNTLDDDTTSRGYPPPQVTASTAQHLTPRNTLDDDTALRGNSPQQVTLTSQHLTLRNTLDDDTASRGYSPPQVTASTAQQCQKQSEQWDSFDAQSRQNRAPAEENSRGNKEACVQSNSLLPLPRNDVNFLKDVILQTPEEKNVPVEGDRGVSLTSPRAQKVSSRRDGLKGEMATMNRIPAGVAGSSEQQSTVPYQNQTLLIKPKQDTQVLSHSDFSLTQLTSPSWPPPQKHSSKDNECLSELVLTSPLPLSSQRAWLKTAVLRKGRLPFPLIPSSSDTCLKHWDGFSPSSSVETCGGNGTHTMVSQVAEVPPAIQLARSYADDLAFLDGCYHELSKSSSHQRTKKSRLPPLICNDCTNSHSKFSQSCLVRMQHDLQDDVLDTFLSEYRQNKRSRHPSPPSHPSHPSHPSTSTQLNEAVSALCSAPFSRDHGLAEGIREAPSHFPIPELPVGKELIINILSTWGDRFYVGLTGLELFTATGEQPKIIQISAEPSDINMLSQPTCDPQGVANLLDGSNQTRDDRHMWLSPYTPGQDLKIDVKFSDPCSLALIRIWNYNKSRIHSSRGACHVQMFLDGLMIFTGEIAQGTGSETPGDSETILFTVDEEVLHRVSCHDPVYQKYLTSKDPYNPSVDDEVCCPRTAEAAVLPLIPQWPSTSSMTSGIGLSSTESSTRVGKELDASLGHVAGSEVHLVLSSSWGDPLYIGLTGFALLEAGSEEPVLPRPDQVYILPAPSKGEDENYVCHPSSELAAIVDGVNVTTDVAHMWTCPSPGTAGVGPTLVVKLDRRTALQGLRVWNYNASLEDSYKGVRQVCVYVDGCAVLCSSSQEGKGQLLRRAPGHVQYNFSQDILFQPQGKQRGSAGRASSREETRTHCLPRGFVFQLQLFSTWGDPYYVGLNGLELYNEKGNKIPLTEKNIAAFPDSVNVLPDLTADVLTADVRTPDKLVDGVNDTDDGKHAWLSPIFPGLTNSIFVIFDQPHTVSLVNLWNYRKAPSRGVKELSLLVDDLLVFTGSMPKAHASARGILPTLSAPLYPFSISFSDSAQGDSVLLPGHHFSTRDGEVQFTNNQHVVIGGTKQHPAPDQDLRPVTHMTVSATRGDPR